MSYHTICEREKAMLSGVFLQTMQYSMNHTFGSYQKPHQSHTLFLNLSILHVDMLGYIVIRYDGMVIKNFKS